MLTPYVWCSSDLFWLQGIIERMWRQRDLTARRVFRSHVSGTVGIDRTCGKFGQFLLILGLATKLISIKFRQTWMFSIATSGWRLFLPPGFFHPVHLFSFAWHRFSIANPGWWLFPPPDSVHPAHLSRLMTNDTIRWTSFSFDVWKSFGIPIYCWTALCFIPLK